MSVIKLLDIEILDYAYSRVDQLVLARAENAVEALQAY
jgi:hypothetical protein